MKCYKCGKEMKDKNGNNYIGKQIELIVNKEMKKDEVFFRKQWGKWYEPAQEIINICFECYIDAELGYKGDKQCQQ